MPPIHPSDDEDHQESWEDVTAISAQRPRAIEQHSNNEVTTDDQHTSSLQPTAAIKPRLSTMAAWNGVKVKVHAGSILLVIHDFVARSEDELSLAKGDCIELTELDDNFGEGWFLGRHMATGSTGLFPEGRSQHVVDQEGTLTVGSLHYPCAQRYCLHSFRITNVRCAPCRPRGQRISPGGVVLVTRSSSALRRARTI